MSEKDYVIEESGQYRGVDWVVRFVEMGHRCGYVRIEDDALFDKYVKENDENIMIPSLDVHGGITFIKKLEDGNGFGLPAGNWLGFDAAHAWDIIDYQSARKYFGNNERYDNLEQLDLHYCIKDASVKTKEYMISECKSLIDQILGE